MCRILAVSSAGYYKWLKRSKNDGNELDSKNFLIKTEFENHNRKYGSPRISKKISGKGI